jgi:hypothetical protein
LSDEAEGVKAMSASTTQVIEPAARVEKATKAEKITNPMPEIEPESVETEGPLASRLLEARGKKRE